MPTAGTTLHTLIKHFTTHLCRHRGLSLKVSERSLQSWATSKNNLWHAAAAVV